MVNGVPTCILYKRDIFSVIKIENKKQSCNWILQTKMFKECTFGCSCLFIDNFV